MASETLTQQTAEEQGPLFADFPIPTFEQWREAVVKSLKGRPLEKLITKTYEGIDLQPLYRREDIADLPHLGGLPGMAPYLRGTTLLGRNDWQVCQALPYGDAKTFNQALRADLKRGQNAINLVLDAPTRQGEDAGQSGQDGLSVTCVADLEQALEDVDLAGMPLLVQAPAALPLTALIAALQQRRSQDCAELTGCLGLDPLGELAEQGALATPLPQVYDEMTCLTNWAQATAPQLQTVLAQGAPYHNGGASATQELAFTLAAAVEYLRALQDRGVAIDTAAAHTRFAFSIGSRLFTEIARLRAARLLWAKIVQAFGGGEAAQKMPIHARTSAWNKTVFDPHVNMLRTTVEAFAGVVGGCDSLYVAPFDEVFGPPDEFSRRIARNTHAILREESQLTDTADPAGGSWYVEGLTDAVARESWRLFQEVEKQGGLQQTLESGWVQEQIATVSAARAVNLGRRRDVLVGTNMYPNPKEERRQSDSADLAGVRAQRSAQVADVAIRDAALEKLAEGGAATMPAAIEAAAAGATLGEITRALRTGAGAGPNVDAIPATRAAQPFEALRQAAERQAQQTGAPPKVFSANLGPLAQHKPRADFTANFFSVAGFEIIGSGGFDNAAAAAQAALATGAPIVVICGADPVYPEHVPSLAQQLKRERPELIVLLAGYPSEHIEAFQAAGVDDFIHLRSNCYDTLHQLLQKLGVVS